MCLSLFFSSISSYRNDMIRQYVKTEIVPLKSVNPNWWSSIDRGGLSQCPKGLYMTGNQLQENLQLISNSRVSLVCQLPILPGLKKLVCQISLTLENII